MPGSSGAREDASRALKNKNTPRQPSNGPYIEIDNPGTETNDPGTEANMADYGSQVGPSTSHQRDQAFSSIFGAPPPGRSAAPQQSQAHGDRSASLTAASYNAAQRAAHPSHQPNSPQQYRPYPGVDVHTPNGFSSPNPPVRQTQQQQPQPQYLPQPLYPARRPLPPQRLDPRASGPTAPHNYSTPPAQRGSSGPLSSAPMPAFNNDSFRTQSLVSIPRPPPFRQQANGATGPPASAFRHGPYSSQPARTTREGRVIPERHDERTMSMTSLPRDADFNQTVSGRVIPNRRRESASTTDLSNTTPRYSTDGYGNMQRPNGRASDIIRTPSSENQSRTMSMASTITNNDRSDSMATTRRPSMTSNSSTVVVQQAPVARRRTPLVYPAMLSKVADAFRERIPLADKEKDGLVYKSAFTGYEAVDLIMYIMQTTDRNLALLLGRSLDAQKFFHDVTYDHRLRDSQHELYQFRETLVDEGSGVNGVFTLTTECYSPTCTPDRLCYSIACPRRVDQMKRLNMKPSSGLKRQDSHTSLHEDEKSDEQKLWINTVPKEIADSVSDREKKRQEVLSELMYTERDFVKDLEYLRDFWQKPLRLASSPIPAHRQEKFIRTVFANIQEIYAVNCKLAEALTKRQQQNPVVYRIGDIFLDYIPRFSPFVTYGGNQLFGKFEYEKEKQQNAAFAKFADITERKKESRKLELNGYLTKPTTRLARYPLLLENIDKYTADDNPDKKDIKKAIEDIRAILRKVNEQSGKSENYFTLIQLSQSLVWRPGERVDLKLTEPSRQLLFKGSLRKSATDSSGEIQTYLFDNALLFVRAKTVNKREELKVYKPPIPLGLLVIAQTDEVIPRMGLAKRPSSSLIPGAKASGAGATKAEAGKQQGFPITFKHLGKAGYETTLYSSTQIQREKWIKMVDTQQKALEERSRVFTQNVRSQGFFTYGGNKVNCCVPIDGGRKLVVGTDVGLFVCDSRSRDAASVRPRKVLDLKSITQVDVLEQHRILLVLSDKTLYSYSMDALDPEEGPLAQSRRERKISGANFFKIGVFEGQHHVCCVKSNTLSATIKVYKPMDSMTNSKKKSGIAKMLAGGQEVLKPQKEFYVPSETYSVHFLRASLCVGCARGFEIVLLDTLVTQPLLDQADTSLDFVAQKENLKPIHVERINRDFLLCYSDFSFFVNRHGWRTMPEWRITWEGNPQSFAIFGFYILAFEPSFIEIRHMDDASLVYILTARNVRMLHSSNREILYAYENENGEDVIASLDFWDPQGRVTPQRLN